MKSAYAGIIRFLVLPQGATTGARIVLDGTNGQILVYDSTNSLIMSVDGTNGLKVPLAANKYIQLWRSGGEPTIHVESSGGYLEMRSVTGTPAIDFYDASLGYTWRINTNTTGINLFSPFTAQPSFSMVSGEGVALSSSVVGYSVLYDEDSGFLKVGIASPWSENNWINITLPGGWGTITPCQYKRFPDGMVRLRGIVNASVSPIPPGTVLTTLPVGYRPTQDTFFPIVFDASGTHGRALVYTTGVVELYESPNNTPSLASIAFSVIN